VDHRHLHSFPTRRSSDLSATQKGLGLAEKGRCQEALAILKKAAPLTSDKQLKIKAGLAMVRCGLQSNQTEATLNALQWLNREFRSEEHTSELQSLAYLVC